jgi:hypothetical protein
MLWFPSYHGVGYEAGETTDYSGQNWFYFVNAAPTAKPVNTTTTPLGMGNAKTTGQWLRDPAAENLKEDSIFSSARTIAACMTMDYVGQLNEAKGQFAVIQNLDVAALCNSKRELDFPSVNQVFDYGLTRGRIPLEGHQVVWRPSDEDAKNRQIPGKGLGITYEASLADALFASGEVLAHTTRLNDPDPGEARGICIAWRGVPENSLVFNTVKVAEYTLAMKSKAVEVPVTAAKSGYSIDKAVKSLDEMLPGWQQSALRGATAMAKHAMASYILPTPMTYLSRGAPSFAIMDGEL